MRTLMTLAFLLLALPPLVAAQEPAFTRADTLRGSITPERAWWDVTFYDLHVRLDPSDSTIRGWNGITYRVTGRAREMQIDLQEPLRVDSVLQQGRRLRYRREGNAVFVRVEGGGTTGQAGALRHGLSRALVEFNPELRPKLKSSGFLTRDPRKVERKKYGRPGARKRFQFSKR